MWFTFDAVVPVGEPLAVGNDHFFAEEIRFYPLLVEMGLSDVFEQRLLFFVGLHVDELLDVELRLVGVLRGTLHAEDLADVVASLH